MPFKDFLLRTNATYKMVTLVIVLIQKTKGKLKEHAKQQGPVSIWQNVQVLMETNKKIFK